MIFTGEVGGVDEVVKRDLDAECDGLAIDLSGFTVKSLDELLILDTDSGKKNGSTSGGSGSCEFSDVSEATGHGCIESVDDVGCIGGLGDVGDDCVWILGFNLG